MRAALVLLVSAFLLFGCIGTGLPEDDESPPAPPGNVLSGSQEKPIVPSWQKEEQTELPQQDVPPAPPSQQNNIPAQQNPQNQNQPSASNPQDSVPARVVPSEPISKSALLEFGQSLDFGEGTVRFDEASDHESGVTILSILTPNGGLYKSRQVFPGNELSYVSPSGRKFWIYLSEADRGYSMYVQRAKVSVLEARETGESFDKKLYSDAIGNETIASAERAKAFGRQTAYGVLNQTQMLNANGFLVGLSELRKYPATAQPAMLTIYDETQRFLAYKAVPPGHAFIHKSDNGKKYAIFVEATGMGKLQDERLAAIKIFEAGSALEEGRLYGISPATQQKPDTGYVGKIEFSQTLLGDTGRELFLKLYNYGGTGAVRGSFAVVAIIDDDGFEVSRGMATQTVHFSFSDRFGRSYSLWLDSLSDGTAIVSMYRTG